jgi:hypothetical protein
MTYPTELIAKVKYEIDIFERPSAETSLELVAEVVMLRSLVRDMRDAVMSASASSFAGDNKRLGDVIAESMHSVSVVA